MEDERLKANISKAQNIMSLYFALLVFIILFLLDQNLDSGVILIIGTIFYTAAFFIKPF